MSRETSPQAVGFDRRGVGTHGGIPDAKRVRLAGGIALALMLGGVIAWSDAAGAGPDSRHQRSSSYDVYVGLVPATQTMRDPQLDQMHRTAGQHADKFKDSTQHVTVAVFRRADGRRVENAQVSAELMENDLIHIQRTKKPLNQRNLTGGITYCNFFDLRWKGGYQIDVTIQETGHGAEKVSFVQKSF